MEPQDEIAYLGNDAGLVHTVAAWHQAQWGHLSARTTEDRIAEFAEHADPSAIPLTLVVYRAARPVGTASLLRHDMDIRPELHPWLASVYVVPELRGRGIGTRLVERAQGEARRLGVAALYLFTPDRAGFYRRLGWEELETLVYHGERETLMRLEVGG